MQTNRRAFLRDQSGGVTVEFVIWLPAFLLVLMLAVDVSLVFLAQSRLWSVAGDTARRMSIGTLGETAAEAFAASAATFRDGRQPEVEAEVSPSEVSVRLSLDSGAVSLFGVFPPGAGQPIIARVTQLREPS
jgi:Flp pilus assembly protein TadG